MIPNHKLNEEWRYHIPLKKQILATYESCQIGSISYHIGIFVQLDTRLIVFIQNFTQQRCRKTN